MPAYMLRSLQSGAVVEHYLSYAEFDAARAAARDILGDPEAFELYLEGQYWLVAMDHQQPHCQAGGGHGWPMYSQALGVPDPAQRAEMTRHYKETHGLDVRFRHRDGAMEHPDRAHRRAVHQADGLIDRDAGYGDASAVKQTLGD